MVLPVVNERIGRGRSGLWALAGLWVAVCPCGPTVQAATFYVATNGDDTVHNSWSTAFTNIQDALVAAGTNDTICLAGHLFGVSSQVMWSISHQRIEGGYAATSDVALPGPRDPVQWLTTVRLAGANSRVFLAKAVTNGVLDGVAFTGGSLSLAGSTAYGAGLFLSNCVGLIVSDCVVSGNTAIDSGTARGGGIFQLGGTVIISNCVVDKNRVVGSGNGQGHGAGVHVTGGGTQVQFGVVLSNNRGTTGWNVSRGGGLWTDGTVHVRNGLIHGNVVRSTGNGVHVAGGSCLLDHCTVAFNFTNGISQAGGTAMVTNSILWANGDEVAGSVGLSHCDVQDGESAGSNGCFSADPRFEFGFYLAADSPCANAGTNDAIDWGLDALTTRAAGDPDSGRVDLGYHASAGMDLSRADLYVSAGGSDGNSGTNEAEAVRTLTRALQLANDGSRIHVAPGHYTNGLETFPLVVDGILGLQILGTNSRATVINAMGQKRAMAFTDVAGALRLEGISVTGGKTNSGLPHPDTGDGGGVYVDNCGDVTLSGCAITNNSCADTGSAYGGGVCITLSAVTISNCMVRGNVASGSGNGVGRGGGLALLSGSLLLKDSELADNQALSVGKTGFGAGLYSQGDAVLRNDLVRGNAVTYTNHGALYANGGSLRIENCTLVYNGIVCVNRAAGAVALTNSILWGNGDDIAGSVSVAWCDIENGDSQGVNGCIRADPGFEFGFYLASNSPCVDAGTNSAADWGLDGRVTSYDGTPDSGRVDMGYHYPQGASLVYANVYVTTNGSDLNSGTNWGEAFRTLTKAFSAAADGSTVRIGAGRFTNGLERFPLVIDGLGGVEILGAGSGETVIDAQQGSRVMELRNITGRALISGVTVTGGRTNTVVSPHPNTGDGGGLLIENCGDLSLVSCVVSNNQCTDSVSAEGGGLRIVSSTVTLTNCIIRDNAAMGSGNGSSYGGGIDMQSGVLRCEETVIVSNRALNYGYGAGMRSAAMTTLHHCLLAGNAAARDGDGLYVSAGSTRGNHLTVANNAGQGVSGAGGSTVVSNSILWGNGDDISGKVAVAYCDIEDGDSNGVAGCFSESPAFVDEVYFHLTSSKGSVVGGYFGGSWFRMPGSSPCIDAAEPDAPWDREPFPHGRRANLGAYGNTPYAALSPRASGTLFVVR